MEQFPKQMDKKTLSPEEQKEQALKNARKRAESVASVEAEEYVLRKEQGSKEVEEDFLDSLIKKVGLELPVGEQLKIFESAENAFNQRIAQEKNPERQKKLKDAAKIIENAKNKRFLELKEGGGK